MTRQFIQFEDVELSVLPKVKDVFFKTLHDVCSKGINMSRMEDVINKQIMEVPPTRLLTVQNYNAIEEQPHGTLQHEFLSFFLYGTDDSQMERLNSIPQLHDLKSKDSAFWVALIKR